jgi:hypothetical protein
MEKMKDEQVTMAIAEPSIGPIQPFACDGQVGEEKLIELITVGAEHPSLDFKRELNLGIAGKKLDFIKDCASMMNLPRGGYLVVGAEDDGKPAKGYLTPSKEMFDSARLVQTVKGYVDAAVDIRAQVHTVMIEGEPASMAVIYIAPPADGIPAVIFKDGFSPSPADGKQITHFRAGMVFTREGTTNAPVRHQSWAQVLENFRDQQRVAARADVDSLVHRVVQMMGTASTPGRIIPDLAMDPGTFTEAVRETLDTEDNKAIRRFLVSARGSYRGSEDEETRSLALNRIAAIATEAVGIRDLKVVEQVTDILFELYKGHLSEPGRTGGKRGAETWWLAIILRIMSIGAAAVREGMYEAIPTLVLRHIGDDVYYYPSWIRHGLTMASRENLFVGEDGSTRGGGLIAMTSEIIAEHPELRPDMTHESDPGEECLDSLCQFDFLWCCLSLASDNNRRSESFYPSCSAYHQRRVMPVVLRIDSDADTRRAVFGEITDDEAASSILTVIEHARRQSWNYGGFWGGARELPPTGFISTHATDDWSKVV